MPAHPHPPIRHCPAPHAGLPARYVVKRKSSDDRLYENFLANLWKTVIAVMVIVLVFIGIVRLMDSKKLPLLKVSAEALQGDGKFTLSTEVGFVREAYKPDGRKMSQDELRKLAEQPDAKFDFELVDAGFPSQW
jgi:hypothetical protein